MQGNPVAVQAATNWNLIGRGLTAPPPVLSPSSTVPPHSPLSAVRPATCVIAQQYCAPTFTSQCGPPRHLCYRPTVLCSHIHLSVRSAPPPVLSPNSTVPPHSPLSAVRPAACVIAQQYCAPTFTSQCGPPRRLCYRPTVLCPHIHLSVRSTPPPVLSPNSTVLPYSLLSAVIPARKNSSHISKMLFQFFTVS